MSSDDVTFRKKSDTLEEKVQEPEPSFDVNIGANQVYSFGEKKKKKVQAESQDGVPSSSTHDRPVADSSLYSYEYLLNRIQSFIDDKNPDLQGSKKYKIKPPQVGRIGSKKVAWNNFQEMCTIMQRNSDHVLQFVLTELGAEGSIGGDGQLILKGKFASKHIESLLRKYIVEYVTCSMCKHPKTSLKRDSSTRLYNIICDACGASRSVATIKSGFHAVSRADRRKAKQTV